MVVGASSISCGFFRQSGLGPWGRNNNEAPARAVVPSQVEKYSYNAIIQQQENTKQKTDNGKKLGKEKPNQTKPSQAKPSRQKKSNQHCKMKQRA